MSILVVLEQRAGMSLETIAAGQQLAKELGTTVSAALLGQSVEAPDAALEAMVPKMRPVLGLTYSPAGNPVPVYSSVCPLLSLACTCKATSSPATLVWLPG